MAAGKPGCGWCTSWLPWIVDGTDQDFDGRARQAIIPVRVDLWGACCGPCCVVSSTVRRNISGDYLTAAHVGVGYPAKKFPTKLRCGRASEFVLTGGLGTPLFTDPAPTST